CTVPGQGTCFVDLSENVSEAFQVVGSHELTETVTDPDSTPGGWFNDRTGDENADICAADACVGTVSSVMETFSVNPAWSNLAKGCITSVPCPPQPKIARRVGELADGDAERLACQSGHVDGLERT
ncbi:MAG: hypothetical protein ACRD3Q_21975, partial [Terriglobales bacterium]